MLSYYLSNAHTMQHMQRFFLVYMCIGYMLFAYMPQDSNTNAWRNVLNKALFLITAQLRLYHDAYVYICIIYIL